MKNGFTLIELMVVVAIVGILAAIVVPAYNSRNNPDISVGINGFIESRCIDGYKFTIDRDGAARQMLSEFGKGVPCTNQSQTVTPSVKDNPAKPTGR